jgi:hypothetical protein
LLASEKSLQLNHDSFGRMARRLGVPATLEDRKLAVTHLGWSRRWKTCIGAIAAIAGLAIGALAIYRLTGPSEEARKQYWATSLSRTVEGALLQGLQEAVARGEVGWLDVDPKYPVPAMTAGVNLILYHVGGNCYIGSDCDRFPASEPTGDQWGGTERMIDLNDPQTRKLVVADLIGIVRQGDELAPNGSIIGVHLDNVHRLDADGLAKVFNDYLQAVEAAKREGLISTTRTVGYVAKNNAEAFRKALSRQLLSAAPLYQINENATLSQDGELDDDSRVAQGTGRRYGIPVFLKTFGTDVAYTTEQDGNEVDVTVSQDMTKRMAQLPNISGAAWSPNERRYQPTLFAQGSRVRPVLFPYGSRLGKWLDF